jgi:hypothetical protein
MSDEQQGAGATTDEQRARALREQLKALHTFDLAYEMMSSLVSFGYQKMGLTDETRDLRDLGDARLAIELLRANLGVVESELGEDVARDLRGALAQMQLRFADAVRSAGGHAAPSPQAAAPAAEGASAGEPEAADTSVTPDKALVEDGSGNEPDGDGAAEKPADKGPAAKPSAAKKTAAKKAAAKRPAARKPAAKKPRGGSTPSAG